MGEPGRGLLREERCPFPATRLSCSLTRVGGQPAAASSCPRTKLRQGGSLRLALLMGDGLRAHGWAGASVSFLSKEAEQSNPRQLRQSRKPRENSCLGAPRASHHTAVSPRTKLPPTASGLSSLRTGHGVWEQRGKLEAPLLRGQGEDAAARCDRLHASPTLTAHSRGRPTPRGQKTSPTCALQRKQRTPHSQLALGKRTWLSMALASGTAQSAPALGGPGGCVGGGDSSTGAGGRSNEPGRKAWDHCRPSRSVSSQASPAPQPCQVMGTQTRAQLPLGA